MEVGSRFGKGRLQGEEGEGDREDAIRQSEETIEARISLGGGRSSRTDGVLLHHRGPPWVSCCHK
jgi:hypothetical protein